MIRRSFRLGLRLGLVAGLVFLLAKRFGSRSEPAPPLLRAAPSAPWPRLPSDPARPAPATVGLVPDPAAPAADAPVVEEAVVTPAAESPSVEEAVVTPAAEQPAPLRTWVEPAGTVCPTSHPVKAKLTSRIFHLPGMTNYGRTKPDRCYQDATAAEADGLRLAKR